MSRFDGCPDRLKCVTDCPGPGLIGLQSGDTVLVTEPFCTNTYPNESARAGLLGGIAKRRVVCLEAALDARAAALDPAKHVGDVVLTAQPPDLSTDPTVLLIYSPSNAGDRPAQAV